MGGLASPRAAETVPVQAIPARDGEDALTALVDLVGDDLQACNRAVIARMDSPVALIPQLAAHIVAAGGKRLRPLLTLASARLCGPPAIDREFKTIDFLTLIGLQRVPDRVRTRLF